MSSTIIESEKVIIPKSAQEIFTFLCDFNNIIKLLPQDKITEWQSTTEQCSFKVQNAATISLVKQDVFPSYQINISSGEKAPFPFTLQAFINENENGCECYFRFDGEINAFLKMMVVTPLTNLFNYMTKKLKEVMIMG